jgi:hypothetical protein
MFGVKWSLKYESICWLVYHGIIATGTGEKLEAVRCCNPALLGTLNKSI